ncbi:MAG TPA: aquaporin [Candidatus Limnocylindrales bacterium]|jgi:aquaporin Z
MNVRALAAEAIGTFILVLMGSFGISSAIILTNPQDPSLVILLIVPFAFGLGLLAAIAIAGETSGGHFNPAVTLAALFDARLGWVDAIGYAIAQVIGAVAASLTIRLLLTQDFVAATINRAGATAADATTAQIHAFATEVFLTTVFVAVILTVTRKAPSAAIFVIPLTLIGIHFVGITISGASVNPARSLGPAMVAGDYNGLWVYLTAPFAGSIIGWAIYRLFNSPDNGAADDADEDDSDLDDLDGFDDELDDARA